VLVDLSVIVVSWNVSNLLRCCLRSLHQSLGAGPLRWEVIVVDNASADDTVPMVRAEFPGVRLLVNEENPGFSAANNQGMAAGRGRYFLLLNPDTEVLDDGAALLVAFADANPDVGVAGPMLLNPDGSVQPSRRRLPTLATAVFESTWLERWAPRGVLARYYVGDRPDDELQDVDWVSGAALLARRSAVEQVGGMDERYFMYWEELDWCRRLGEAGWRVSYVPQARIVHRGGGSSEQVSAQRHIHFQRSKLLYFRKHHGRAAAAFLRTYVLCSYGWQILLEGAKWTVGHKRSLRAERVRAYWQVLRSGLTGP
jgi:N-acetylglucosaminyl-diphospho-decaprenol L-rhamnosyltransferase